MKKSKRAMELEVLGWWILGIATLIAVVIGFIVLRGKGGGALEFIKNIFRFGAG